MFAALVAGNDVMQAGAGALPVGQHLGDRRAVLAFEAKDQRQPLFDLGEAARVVLHTFSVGAQVAGQVIRLALQGVR